MYYASIGGVRIQTWIAQSSTKLALVRGASILLTKYTANSAIATWLATQKIPGVTVAADSGDVDGVIVLTSDDVDKLHSAAEGLIQHLEQTIPGLAWEGWAGEGNSYLDAYARHAADSLALVSLPPLPELGLVETCGWCGAEPAIKPLTIGDQYDIKMAGRGCIERKGARDGQNRDVYRGKLWDDIPGKWPDDFRVLAREGGPDTLRAVGRKDSRSHLATVAADGNGIGNLFLRINELGLDSLRAQAVKLLNETTINAVTEAAKACGSCKVKVVIPHYVGGDDVFTSVTASAVWTFAAQLGVEFERLKEKLKALISPDRADTADLEAAIDKLGLGIGIAFAGASVPISATSEAAHLALGKAKAHTEGGPSAIGWVDLTAAADTLYAVSVEDIEMELTHPNAVFTLPASARASLAAIVRSAPDDLSAAVRRWGDRTGNEIPDYLVDSLPQILSRARWWPNLPEEDR